MGDRLRSEQRLLARVMAPGSAASALKARLLALEQQAPPAAAPRAAFGLRAGLRVQLAAATLLFGALLFFICSSGGGRHSLLAGSVRFPDGRTLTAPAEFDGSRVWPLRAAGDVTLQLEDGSTLELSPESEVILRPRDGLGGGVELVSGRVRLVASGRTSRAELHGPGGWARILEGSVQMETILEGEHDMNKKLLAATLVTVLSGSASLGNSMGNVECSAGGAVALSRSQGPCLLVPSQTSPKDSLRQLEALAAQVEDLEKEIQDLEAQNRALKAKLAARPAANSVTGAAAGSGAAGSGRTK
jgi:hypothetical protein